MHYPLLVAALAGSAVGFALPGREARDVPSDDGSVHDTAHMPEQSAEKATAHGAGALTSSCTDNKDTATATQAAYITSTRSLPSEGGAGLPEHSSAPDEHSESSDDASAWGEGGHPVISHVASSITDASAWPTLMPAVPGNQPAAGLDSLAPTNSTKLTFTLDGNSDPATQHLFAEMTANHTRPAVILEHSAQIVAVSCAAQGLEVGLASTAAIDFVRLAWSENFISITSSIDCGDGGGDGSGPHHHSYWNVTAVSYPGTPLTALLHAVQIEVEDFFDHVHLAWGTHVPLESPPPPGPTASVTGDGASSNGPAAEDDDHHGGYMDFDDYFSSRLQRFAPGLSTYSEDDYDSDNSPANGTVGDPDYDIANSGVLDTDEGDEQAASEPIEKRQEQPRPAQKDYARPKPPKPARKGHDEPYPAPARKPYVVDRTEQEAELAKENSKVQDKGYSGAAANLKNARKAAAAARNAYFNAQQESKAEPKDQTLAQKLKTAKANLATQNQRVQNASKIAEQLAKSAKEAKKKDTAAQSVKDAAAKGGWADGSVKADPLAIADKVAKETLNKLQADPRLADNARSTARGLIGYLQNTYNQLARKVKEVVNRLSTIKPDYTFPIDVSLARTMKSRVVEDSPWGPQFLIGQGERVSESGAQSVTWSMYCVDCGFTATIHIAGEISFSVTEGRMTKGNIDIEGRDIAAKMFLGLEAYYAAEWTGQEPVLDVAIPPGFSIPKIITLGPAIRYAVRARLNLEADGIVLAGGDATFSDFKASVDVVNTKNSKFDGFKPKWEPMFEAYGAIRAGVRLGYPLTIGVTMHLPMLKNDTGIALTNEPYVQAVASYGDVKNCSRGIHYTVYGGNDVYANFLNLVSATFLAWKSPPIRQGCKAIPAAILKLLPPPLSDFYDDGMEEGDGEPEHDDEAVINKAKGATTGSSSASDNLVYSTVTAGNGEWSLFGDGDDGTLSLVPSDDVDDASLTQRTFAYVKNVVTADAADRLLHFSRSNIDDASLRVSRLELVDEDNVADDHEAVTLVTVRGKAAKGAAAVLVPVDTYGTSYTPVACVVTDDMEDETNTVFAVVNVDEGIRTLQSGRAAVKKLAGGVVGKCVEVAFDATGGI